MQARVKWIAGVGIVTVLGGIAYWRMRPADIVYDTAVVTRGNVDEVLVEDGRTRARWHLDITAPVSGEWQPSALKAGDTVRAGALLGSLRVAPLDPQSIAQLRAQVGVAEAALVAVQAQEAEARVAAREASRARERTERLISSGGISDEQLEIARNTDEARKRELEAVQAQVRAAGYTLESARAVIPNGNREPIALRAPVDAIVLRVDEEHARVLPAGATLMQIGSTGNPEIVLRVLSADAPRVQLGAPLTVLVGGDTLLGRVTRIEPGAVTVRSALGVEEQRVPVIGDVAGGRVRLGHDYQVEARIVVVRELSALRIPVSALVRDGNEWSVFVRDAKGTLTRKHIRVRAQGLEFAAIDGLQEGETVVLYPPEALEQAGR